MTMLIRHGPTKTRRNAFPWQDALPCVSQRDLLQSQHRLTDNSRVILWKYKCTRLFWPALWNECISERFSAGRLENKQHSLCSVQHLWQKPVTVPPQSFVHCCAPSFPSTRFHCVALFFQTFDKPLIFICVNCTSVGFLPHGLLYSIHFLKT